MAAPLIVLYGISILIVKSVNPDKSTEEEEEDETEIEIEENDA
jgi:sec-independent protein translocase protein TatC